MRRHQSESHGISSLAHPVNLQTFFRGTKLRYFEVSSLAADGTAHITSSTSNSGDVDHVDHVVDGGYVEEQPDLPTDDVGPTMSMPPPPITAFQGVSSTVLPVDVNLDTLTYFHHFITTTSLTLPITHPKGLDSHYWQRDIVTQALTRRWLMCGLLAIAACHLALLTEDTTLAHRQRLEYLSSVFFKERDEIASPSMSLELLEPEEATKKAGDRIACVLSCAHSALHAHTLADSIVSPPANQPQLRRIVSSLRCLVTCHVSSDHDSIQGNINDSVEDMFTHATRILTSTSSDNVLYGVLNRIGGLPFRMTEAFGRPESTTGVLEVIAAIGALIESCAIAFNSAEPSAGWRGLATWFAQVPVSFDEMVFQYNPAALVVLAHWAALLLKRAEQCGCWVLGGTAKTLLIFIGEILPANNHEVHSLFAGLEDV
jgi:hypothetical protein